MRTINVSLLLFLLHAMASARAQSDGVEHFERHVRPVLVNSCLKCHGSKKQEGGLRLDSRKSAIRGSELTGSVIDSDNPLNSTLYRAVQHLDGLTMPPDRKLPETDILAIRKWLLDGAPWPETGSATEATPGDKWKRHWAARPVTTPDVPDVRNPDRVYTPVDAFILRQLEQSNVAPSESADPRTLLRRAHFAITGLPPTMSETGQFRREFAQDPRRAMQQLVERLLDSPHYGERWGRHWLDIARYADTKGYVRLQEQPNFNYAYTYRDYVVNAFNSDKPYDQFVLEQLAADLTVHSDDNTSLAALGFLTLGRRFTGNQHDIIDDRIDVVTRGLMGITVTCARCHDHKFDPIPTDDYYALYGVFASTTEPSDLPILSQTADRPVFHGDMAVFNEKQTALNKEIQQYLPATLNMLRADTTRYLRGVLEGRKEFLVPLPAARGELRQTFVERWIEYLEGTRRGHHPVFAIWHRLRELPENEFAARARETVDSTDANPVIRAALQRSSLQSMNVVAEVYGRILTTMHQKWQTERQTDKDAVKFADADEEQLRQVLYGEDSAFALSPREALDSYLLEASENQKVAQAYLAFDSWLIGTRKAAHRSHVLFDSKRVHEPQVFVRGNPERTGRQVRRAAPRLLGQELSEPFRKGSGRLELAQAIIHPQNPLTARVIVNRVWKHHFGQGLVATTSNFGLRADPPTHPQLLNYLAGRFVTEGWSLKKLHRWILLSSTWQQASVDRPDARVIDPENRLLWRSNRRRVDFETLRDSLLVVAGRLNRKTGGPPSELTADDNVRRTIYGRINRSTMPTILQLFDFPSPDIHNPERSTTTAPQQALYLMNSPFVMRQAAALAKRAEVAADDGTELATVRALHELSLGRAPGDLEIQRCQVAIANGTPLAELAQALIICNEFLFVD